MIAPVRWISRLLGFEDDGDKQDEDSESGFLPSRLDVSVLQAHGMGTSQADEELAQLEEQANELERQHPDEK